MYSEAVTAENIVAQSELPFDGRIMPSMKIWKIFESLINAHYILSTPFQ